MKTKQLIFMFLFFSFHSFGQWEILNSNTSENLNGVYFVNSTSGFVVGDNGIILKSNDEGESWDLIDSGTSLDLTSVFFSSDSIGYITGREGIVLKSSDAGNSWQIIREGQNEFSILNNSFFTSDEVGYVVGFGGNFKTINGGQSWTPLDGGSIYGTSDIFFINENIGYLVGGGFSDAIQKTGDGGQSFEAQASGGVAHHSSVFFFDENNGITVGDANITRTINGGIEWLVEETEYDPYLKSITFNSYNYGIIVGGFSSYNIILVSEDGGQTWLEEPAPISNELKEVFFASNEIAFIVGINGTILKKDIPVSLVDLDEYHLEVHPNPTTGQLFITHNHIETKTTFTLFDSQGKEVKKGILDSSNQIDLKELNDGLYFLSVQNDYNLSVHKIVKH